MYATYANEYVGSYDRLIESYRLIVRIFQKYRHKLTSGARKRRYLGSCADEVIHARIHPVTLEEITSEWGHHQLDIFGLFLNQRWPDLLQRHPKGVRLTFKDPVAGVNYQGGRRGFGPGTLRPPGFQRHFSVVHPSPGDSAGLFSGPKP